MVCQQIPSAKNCGESRKQSTSFMTSSFEWKIEPSSAAADVKTDSNPKAPCLNSMVNVASNLTPTLPVFQVLPLDNSSTIPPDTKKYLLVIVRLATEPADSLGADFTACIVVIHPFFITGQNSVQNVLFLLISEQRQSGRFSLALVFSCQFVK
ncbi:hypothetical protein TNCT_98551 [Trichonephila clavata]|uniref:Uncharacterized protein n=1 Tax=Trichonephila clavata TaxID=2740835 RepID=A0A8X6FQA7_TRICU|nr:hypothetical protein TNCT_98551 [Trichonephila clavata]